jgi:hypothetical protein
MTPEDISDKADRTRKQIAEMPRYVPDGFGYGKYVKAEVLIKQILNDHAVLIRELAENQKAKP